MIRKWLSLCFCLLPLWCGGQTLVLDECIGAARRNYPLAVQYGLIEQTRDYTLANVAKGWLPRIGVMAGGYLLTDVLEEGKGAVAAVAPANRLAAGVLTLEQNLYDGGRMAAGRRLAKAEAEVEKSRLDVAMYEVEARVEELFFGILLLDGQWRQNRNLLDDLALSRRRVESLIQGGIVGQGDLEAVEVEVLNARQQQEALECARSSYVRMLGLFIGRKLDPSVPLHRPEMPVGVAGSEGGRPEMAGYAARYRLVGERRKLLDVGLRPTLRFFGAGVLHSRLSDGIRNGMMLGGLTLSWNIGALYTRGNDLKKLAAEQLLIKVQQETFLFNNRMEDEQANAAIATLRRQLLHDEEVVRLRENIRRRSEKRVEQGTESVNEMLRNVNAVTRARLQKAVREVNLLREVYRLKHINHQNSK